MTKEQFQDWVEWSRRDAVQLGPIAVQPRNWAEAIRRFDPERADAFIRLAEAQETLRRLAVKER
jgi:hypothetical protein